MIIASQRKKTLWLWCIGVFSPVNGMIYALIRCYVDQKRHRSLFDWDSCISLDVLSDIQSILEKIPSSLITKEIEFAAYQVEKRFN
jgi:hypothetical protein